MVKRCHRFEREALLPLERGEKLDEHFTICPDCRESAAAYRKVHELLGQAAERLPAPDGWQERLWAQLRAPSTIAERLEQLMQSVPVPDALELFAGGCSPGSAAAALIHNYSTAAPESVKLPGDKQTWEQVKADCRAFRHPSTMKVMQALCRALRSLCEERGSEHRSSVLAELITLFSIYRRVLSEDFWTGARISHYVLLGRNTAEIALVLGVSEAAVRLLSQKAQTLLPGLLSTSHDADNVGAFSA